LVRAFKVQWYWMSWAFKVQWYGMSCVPWVRVRAELAWYGMNRVVVACSWSRAIDIWRTAAEGADTIG
jgi:hypothetical protein